MILHLLAESSLRAAALAGVVGLLLWASAFATFRRGWPRGPSLSLVHY